MEDTEIKDKILNDELKKGFVKGIVKASKVKGNGKIKLEQYGNSVDYLRARLKRDRPDLYDQMREEWIEKGCPGSSPPAYKYAKLAGIVIEDDTLTKLLKLWDKADLETRQAFVGLCWEEIDAAEEGIYLDKSVTVNPGPKPSPFYPEYAEPIPSLETLLEKGWSLSAIAKEIGVSYRTVTGWRAGRSKPRKSSLEKLAKLAEADGPMGYRP